MRLRVATKFAQYYLQCTKPKMREILSIAHQECSELTKDDIHNVIKKLRKLGTIDLVCALMLYCTAGAP